MHVDECLNGVEIASRCAGWESGDCPEDGLDEDAIEAMKYASMAEEKVCLHLLCSKQARCCPIADNVAISS
jgi:hypothetical protein